MKKLFVVGTFLLVGCASPAMDMDSGAGGADANLSTDAAVSDAPRTTETGGGDPCGPNGMSHGGHCDCSRGYVERMGRCVPLPMCSAPDDMLEENDTAAMATPVPASGLQRTALRVCPGDMDVFRLQLNAMQQVTVEARFTHQRGDIDVYLFRADAELDHDMPLAGSDGTVDNERFMFTAPSAGAYVVVVLGHDGAENTYDLNISTTP